MKQSKVKEITDILKKKIEEGEYGANKPLPSVRKLMRAYDIAHSTAHRVLIELSAMGLAKPRRGAGTYAEHVNRTIGLAIPGTADSEFFSAIMEGVVHDCSTYGMDLVAGGAFAVDHNLRDEQARKLAHHFAATGVAGVIMQPVGFSENANRLNETISRVLDDAGIPVVLIDYDIVPPPARSHYDLVAIDNMAAGRKLAAHLIEAGSKRICCLLRRLCADSVHIRFAGIDDAVFRATGRHVDIIVAEPDDCKAIAGALAGYGPDAIVCSNDIAAGVLAKTLDRLKVRIPDDVMLAGFDDVKLAGEMTPSLTSVRQPCAEIASVAFRTLLERVANPQLPPRQILLDTTLVVRESTTRAAKWKRLVRSGRLCAVDRPDGK